MQKQERKRTYCVEGMYCPACELLMERKLKSLKEIASAKASQLTGKVTVIYKENPLTLQELNALFREEHYKFVEEVPESREKSRKDLWLSFGVASCLIVLFWVWQRLGFGRSVRLDLTSSWWAFLIFGILAGTSSCAALIGSLIIALGKSWSSQFASRNDLKNRLTPHLLFQGGRILAYTVLGVVLGIIGENLRLSATFYSLVVIGVSAGVFLTGLNMVGVRKLPNLTSLLPRFIAKPTENTPKTRLKHGITPFLFGASTILLPCGFTVTVESIALLSANPVRGSLAMGLFALGTMPVLFSIGLSSTILFQNPRLSRLSLRIAGVLLIFFALFNFNTQLNVWGYRSLSDLQVKSAAADHQELATAGRVQTIVMEASVFGYTPNYFKVRANIPVRWEIVDRGISGCTNAIIAPDLFEGELRISPGKTTVKEFVPSSVGKFKFTCWMGMVSGTIEVTQ